MNPFRAVDTLLLTVTERLLDWANEWLSLPQRRVEQILIGVYAAARILGFVAIALKEDSTPLWEDALFAVGMTSYLWLMHQKPAATRMPHVAGNRIGRIIITALSPVLILLAVSLISKRPVSSTALLIHWIVFWAFIYVYSVTGGGESGRRRRIALAKLKEWFGTDWVPHPAGIS